MGVQDYQDRQDIRLQKLREKRNAEREPNIRHNFSAQGFANSYRSPTGQKEASRRIHRAWADSSGRDVGGRFLIKEAPLTSDA